MFTCLIFISYLLDIQKNCFAAKSAVTKAVLLKRTSMKLRVGFEM